MQFDIHFQKWKTQFDLGSWRRLKQIWMCLQVIEKRKISD